MAADVTPPRSRPLRIAAWAAGLLIGLPLALIVLLLAVILVGANTGAGRRLIERQATALTGGLVGIEGLGGRFPDALTVRRITVNDGRGPWLAIDRLVLDWSPLRLLTGTVHVELASAGLIDALRLPVPGPNARPAPPARPGAKSGLHLGILIDRLRVDRLAVEAPVAGTAVAAALDGHVRIADLAPLLDGAAIGRLPDTDLGLRLARLDHPGGLDLAARVAPSRLALHLRVDDPAGGLVTALGHLPILDPLALSLDLDGPRDAERLALSGTAGAPATGVLTLGAHGTVDLLRPRFDVALAVHAPAMQPMPGIAWTKVALDAHLARHPAGAGRAGHGWCWTSSPPTAPASAGSPPASTAGRPWVRCTCTPCWTGCACPDPQPTLLAAAPLTLDATLDPHAAGRPLDLTVSHPLLGVSGHVLTAAPQRGQLALHLPDLAPFAGHRRHRAGRSRRPRRELLPGRAQGRPQPVRTDRHHRRAAAGGGADRARWADHARSASRDGTALALRQLRLDGQALHLAASGTDIAGVLAAQFSLALPSLQRALPSLRGALTVAGTATRPAARPRRPPRRRRRPRHRHHGDRPAASGGGRAAPAVGAGRHRHARRQPRPRADRAEGGGRAAGRRGAAPRAGHAVLEERRRSCRHDAAGRREGAAGQASTCAWRGWPTSAR